LCYEAQLIWKEMLKEPVFSNAPLPGNPLLEDPTHSIAHSAIDLGEDEFTIGRPHPMIDFDLRMRRVLQEAQDPLVGVILLDVVLGYGAHPDPAAQIAPTIRELKDSAYQDGRDVIVISSIVAAQGDPQNLSQTISQLESAGVIVCESNAAAALLAGFIFLKDDFRFGSD
jgi:FdrA protein